MNTTWHTSYSCVAHIIIGDAPTTPCGIPAAAMTKQIDSPLDNDGVTCASCSHMEDVQNYAGADIAGHDPFAI